MSSLLERLRDMEESNIHVWKLRAIDAIDKIEHLQLENERLRRLLSELDLERRRLATSEDLRAGLIAELDRLRKVHGDD